LIKNPLFQDGLNPDERAFLFSFVTAMPVYVSVAFVCPRLFNLLDIPDFACVLDKDGRVFLPTAMSLAVNGLSSRGLYLLDDSKFMYLWIGEEVEKEILADIFQDYKDQKDSKDRAALYSFVQSDDPLHISSRISLMIASLRKGKPNFENLQIINQSRSTNKSGSVSTESAHDMPLDEMQFFNHLIEDADTRWMSKRQKNVDKSGSDKHPNMMSYIDFLCWVHKQIQNKFLTV
jgi:protein transport protein SEC24